MQPGELAFLILVIAALALFGGVLGFASWEETRDRKRKLKIQMAKKTHADETNEAGAPKIKQRAF
jgi:hypothetical protein